MNSAADFSLYFPEINRNLYVHSAAIVKGDPSESNPEEM